MHVQFLRQLEEKGVGINGRWNPALKLPRDLCGPRISLQVELCEHLELECGK